MEADSLYTASTVLCADSIESVPGRSGLFALATYQVDKEEQEAQVSGSQAEASTSSSSSPAYSRRGTCTLHRAVLNHRRLASSTIAPARTVHCDALQVIETPAILDMKWSITRDLVDDHQEARRMLGIANAKGQVSIHQLDETDHALAQQPRLKHLKTLQFNDRKALCLSLDWSDRRGGMEHGYDFADPAPDTSLIVSQSDGSLAYLPSLEAALEAESSATTSQSHDTSDDGLSKRNAKTGSGFQTEHADGDDDEDDWDRTSEDERRSTLLASHSTLNHPFPHQPRGLETWQAHDFEAWIAGFDCWSLGTTIWSGGDDLVLKGWDLRTPNSGIGRQPTFCAKKGFDGGVTTLQSHHLRQHLWAVGSYDSKLRLFDARNPMRAISETEVGGGIWRVKWHPTDPANLLIACMHDGFKTLRLDQLSESGTELKDLRGKEMDIVTRFNGHKSLAYGCDWDRAMDVPGDHQDEVAEKEQRLVYSCSFYDATMHVWRSS